MVRITYIAASALSLAGTTFATCDYGTSQFPREPNVPIGKFSYAGLSGPLDWYGLNETANVMCAKGKNQSPINVNSTLSTICGSDVKFQVDSYPEGAEFENLGTTLEVPLNGTLAVGGRNYKLVQMHFHTPSEHRVDFEYFPMEAHFVFQDENKSIGVVAFLIDFGRANPLLASVFEDLGGATQPGEATLTGPLLFTNLQQHLTSNRVYQYSGSLTTPPCSEDVNWLISTKPIYIDPGTYGDVKGVLKFNSRYTQNALGSIDLLENIAEQLGAPAST